MRNLARVLAFDVAAPLVADRRAALHRRGARLAAVVGVGVFDAVPAHRRGRDRQLRSLPPRLGDRRHRRRRSRAAAGRRRTGHRGAGGRGGRRLHPLDGARPRLHRRHRRGGADRHAVSEATATFTPADPTSSIDRAAALMVPERADAFKNEFGKATADLAKRNISAQAQTISAGVEAIGPSAASVAVIMRGTQSQPGQPPNTAVLALAGRVVQAERPVAGRRRRADQLPLSRA